MTPLCIFSPLWRRSLCGFLSLLIMLFAHLPKLVPSPNLPSFLSEPAGVGGRGMEEGCRASGANFIAPLEPGFIWERIVHWILLVSSLAFGIGAFSMIFSL